jgi:sugar phosphate isomerase/epimerase
MMHLGISSHAFAWAIGVPGFPAPERPWTAWQLIERAADLGVRLVQIADNLPLHARSADELDELLGFAASMGIALEVGTAGIATGNLHRYRELAARLRSPIVRTLLDSPGCEPTLQEAIDTVREVLPEYQRAGICLAIENHDRFRAAALAELMQALDSPAVGICLDTANSLGCGEGWDTVLRRLGPWVVNLHVKDFRADRLPHKKGFLVQGCPAGQGQLEVGVILAELARYGRRPNAVLETWVPPEPTLAETIAKEAVWAEASIAYLRNWFPQ